MGLSSVGMCGVSIDRLFTQNENPENPFLISNIIQWGSYFSAKTQLLVATPAAHLLPMLPWTHGDPGPAKAEDLRISSGLFFEVHSHLHMSTAGEVIQQHHATQLVALQEHLAWDGGMVGWWNGKGII